MTQLHHWGYIQKYGNAYRIFGLSLVAAPLKTNGQPDYEVMYDVSKDAFTEPELAEFLKDLEDATGWKHGEHFKL